MINVPVGKRVTVVQYGLTGDFLKIIHMRMEEVFEAVQKRDMHRMLKAPQDAEEFGRGRSKNLSMRIFGLKLGEILADGITVGFIKPKGIRVDDQNIRSLRYVEGLRLSLALRQRAMR